MTTAALLGCVAVLAGTLGTEASAADSVGEGRARLPLPGYGSAVVDQAHRQVFVSGGSGGQSVVSVALTGRRDVRLGSRVVRLIDAQQGAHGMVLSVDGRTLYAALASGDAVSAIDTVTLRETARYRAPVGEPHVCPTHLARTGTVLWVGYGCEAWEGGIARLDTAAEKPALETDQQGAAIRFERAPALASAPTGTATPAEHILVASQPHLSPVRLLDYTVTADQKLALDTDQRRGGSNLNDLALLPDGSRVLVAAGSEDRVQGFTARKGAGQADNGAWYTQQAPVAVAPAPDGNQVATGVRSGGPNGRQVNVYPLDGTEPVWSAVLPYRERLADRGLVWFPDGSALAAVTNRDGDPAPRLHVLRSSSYEDAPIGWPVPLR